MEVTFLINFLPCITGLAVLYLAYKLFQVLTMKTAYAKMVDKVPGPAAIPILGNAWPLMVPHEEMVDVVLNLFKPFSGYPIIRVWLGFFNPRFACMKAKAAEHILSSSVHITKGDEYRFLHSWLGLGLLTR